MHIIRLRGPWQLQALERYVRRGDSCYERSIDGSPDEDRAEMPADWSGSFGADFLGRVRYRRTFQKPTGLETGERVWLAVEPPCTHGSITLNDRPLGEIRYAEAPARFDITAMLDGHNRLQIDVSHPMLDDAGVAKDDSITDRPGGLVGEVRLEIEE